MLIEQQIAERRERAAAKPPKILKQTVRGPYGDLHLEPHLSQTETVLRSQRASFFEAGLNLIESFASDVSNGRSAHLI